MRGYLDIVKLLIDLGAEVNANDYEALITASYGGNTSKCQIII